MSKDRLRCGGHLCVGEGSPGISVKFGVSLLIGLLVMAAVALYFLIITQREDKSFNDIRENIHERIVVKRFLDNINLEQDPCKNFYQFACGGYINRTVLPRGKNKWAVEDELETKVEGQTRIILGSIDNNQGNLPRPYQHLMHFFNLCKDQDDKSTSEVLADVQNVLEEVGGWPILKDNSTKQQDIFQTGNKMRQKGLYVDVFMKITSNLNSSGINFKVEKPQLLIKGFGEKEKEEYSVYITKVIGRLGLNGSEKYLDIKAIVEVESSLCKIMQPNSDQIPAANYTVAELKYLPSLSWLPWDQLLQSLLPDSIPVNPLYNVTLENPEYVSRLKDLIMQHNESTLVNYLFWRAAEDLLPWGSRDSRALYWSFRKLPKPPFFQRCIQKISRGMTAAVSSLYVNRIFNDSFKIEAMKLVENVRQKVITHNTSIPFDDVKKFKDVTNVSNVEAHIAYPDEITNITVLEDFYKDISGASLVKAWLNLTKWRKHHDISQHFLNKASSDWARFSDVFTPRATFNVDGHYIDINAGFLQPPVFSPEFPAFVNYGGLGFLAAHHLVHALQSTTNEPRTDYKGLSHAYQAYKRVMTSQEPVLPALQHYSPDQLFMLSFANLFCTKYDDVTRYPSPRERMVNVIVKSTPEFTNAFNCSKSP